MHSVAAPQMPAHRRLPELDGIRAIAVTLVIVGHLGSTLQIRSWMTFSRYVSSQFGVGMFFVLSGFLITRLLMGEEEKYGTINLRQFYLRRVLRIIPPAFLYLGTIKVLSVGHLFYCPWKHLASCAFFLKNIFVGSVSHGVRAAPVGHFWSLSVEEQFYLSWPMLLLLLGGRFRLTAVIAVLCLSVTGTEVYEHVHHWLLFREMSYLHWFESIAIGCGLALVRGDRAWMASSIARWLKHGALPLLAIPLSIAAEVMPVGSTFKEILQAGFVALILNYILESPGSAATRFLGIAPIAYIGRLSYSLYLWQELFTCGDSALGLRWFEKLPWAIPLTLICAMLSYYLLERPMIRLRNRLHTPPQISVADQFLVTAPDTSGDTPWSAT